MRKIQKSYKSLSYALATSVLILSLFGCINASDGEGNIKLTWEQEIRLNKDNNYEIFRADEKYGDYVKIDSVNYVTPETEGTEEIDYYDAGTKVYTYIDDNDITPGKVYYYKKKLDYKNLDFVLDYCVSDPGFASNNKDYGLNMEGFLTVFRAQFIEIWKEISEIEDLDGVISGDEGGTIGYNKEIIDAQNIEITLSFNDYRVLDIVNNLMTINGTLELNIVSVFDEDDGMLNVTGEETGTISVTGTPNAYDANVEFDVTVGDRGLTYEETGGVYRINLNGDPQAQEKDWIHVATLPKPTITNVTKKDDTIIVTGKYGPNPFLPYDPLLPAVDHFDVYKCESSISETCDEEDAKNIGQMYPVDMIFTDENPFTGYNIYRINAVDEFGGVSERSDQEGLNFKDWDFGFLSFLFN